MTNSSEKASAEASDKPVTTAKSGAAELSGSSPTANIARPANKGGKGLAIFALLISLGALAGSGFTWYQNQIVRVESESKLAVGVSEIGSQVARLGDSISRIKQDQSNVVTQAQLGNTTLKLETALGEEMKSLANEQIEISESIEKINSDLQTGVNQYVVDEVSQLLRLANNNVLFSSNIKSAIDALSLADNQLKSLSDPRYSIVRSKINEEITALRSVKQADVESLSASLHTIANSVSSLPLANEPESYEPDVAPASVETEVSWRTELKKLWQDILGSVQIQRVDQPPKPLLAPEQRYFLDQNLKLTLAKAELALLQGKTKVFETGVTDAITWLNEYFDITDQRVTSILGQLNEIAAEPIDTAMPDITASYQLLQNIQGGQ